MRVFMACDKPKKWWQITRHAWYWEDTKPGDVDAVHCYRCTAGGIYGGGR